MACNEDKTFSPLPAPSKPFSGVIPPPSPVTDPPSPPAVDPTQQYPNPQGEYALTPDAAVAMGLEVEQFLNRQALAFKALGEEMQVYRQKRFGQPCACVDSVRNQAQDGCRICYGTRFVGGYDYVGQSLGVIGQNPLTRVLTELGLKASQKPSLNMLPTPSLNERDFVVARGRRPTVELLRVQAEPVVRASAHPDMDLLAMKDPSRILKISLSAGGTEDYEDGVDFVLTGGELLVEDAETPPPNSDARTLRVVGKRAPLFPPDGETATGITLPVPVTTAASGLYDGQPVTATNRRTAPQAFTATLSNGTGDDAGYLIVTLQGASGSGIYDKAAFPAGEFLVTAVGGAILWVPGGSRPDDGTTYYASYEAPVDVTRRYQVLNVTVTHFQGASIAQTAEIELMDATHPFYSFLTSKDQVLPLDRQDQVSRELRKAEGQQAGLEEQEPNVSDPRFSNPGDFL